MSNSRALVTEWTEAKDILSDINWNFSTPFSVGRSGLRLFDVRKYHWYPATFIPEIPFTLIDVLTEPGAVIYDPFGGIGTSFFQGLILGRQPYTTEISTVAIMLMRSIWELMCPITDLNDVSLRISKILKKYDPKENYFETKNDSDRYNIDFETLRKWFNKDSFNQIVYLIFNEMDCTESAVKAAFRIVLSSTLKAVSAQDKGWGCIADNMLPKDYQLRRNKDAILRFKHSAGILIRDLIKIQCDLPKEAREFLLSENKENRILHLDVRKNEIIFDESVDFIITSPPYPNMTDYSFSQRLSYYWLAKEISTDIELEIGARRKRSKPDSIKRYLIEMEEAINVFSRKLKVGGYTCLVMPSFNEKKSNNVDRKNAINECHKFMMNNNMSLEAEYERILPTRRRQHNQRWITLEREKIKVYRKT